MLFKYKSEFGVFVKPRIYFVDGGMVWFGGLASASPYRFIPSSEGTDIGQVYYRIEFTWA